MTLAASITILLFAIGLVLGGMKWLHSFVVKVEKLVTKFDERTVNIALHLRKIDDTLSVLAGADLRIRFLEDGQNDHEGRIRKLELHEGDNG